MTAAGDASRTDVDRAGGWLTAAQVAEVLGVKRETVYAYVSRGILHRRLALDGRTSLFDRQQVEDLRRGGRSTSTGELRTVLATAITRVAEGSLVVRGRDLVQLVDSGSGFEAVADLIWQADNTELWRASIDGELPEAFTVTGMMSVLDRFRIAVAIAAAADPLRHDLSAAVVRRTAPRLVRAMVDSLPLVDGADAEPSGPSAGETAMVVARRLWPRLTAQRPDRDRLRALDISAGPAGRSRTRHLDIRSAGRSLGEGRSLRRGRCRTRRARRSAARGGVRRGPPIARHRCGRRRCGGGSGGSWTVAGVDSRLRPHDLPVTGPPLRRALCRCRASMARRRTPARPRSVPAFDRHPNRVGAERRSGPRLPDLDGRDGSWSG